MERQDRQAERADPLSGRPPLETDVLVVGAGPVGLFQVFQLGLQELSVQLVDALPHLGGQCIELYPDKPLYDIPGLPRCTGRELVDRLVAQARPFLQPPHLGQQVETVARRADTRFDVSTSTGTTFIAKTVVIAAGVGAFQPRRLRVEGLVAYEGRQMFYTLDDPSRHAGRRVIVVGDSEEALRAAIALAPIATVTHVHRRDQFAATPGTTAAFQSQRESGSIQFIAAQPTGLVDTAGTLTALRVTDAEDTEHVLDTDTVVALTGLSPKLGPLAEWGVALERKQVVVDTARFETSEPGIHAVGDIVTYPGKRRLILSGFHEATLAAFAIAERQRGAPAPLEYTTTSARLHRLLGVDGP